MLRQLVKSTVIRAVGYDADRKILEVEFHTGRLYRYLSVPPSVHEELVSAESVGEYFNREIRDRYRFVEMTN